MTATVLRPPPALDVERLREDFPILAQRVRGKPLVYLDNAATSQKPRAVIDAVSRFYAAENANIHRGVHYLSERATVAYDGVREQVAAVPQRGVAQRDHLHARHHRGHQPRGPELGPDARFRPGDEILDHRDGAPLEHRPLAARGGADRRRASAPSRSPTPASSI